MTMSNPHTFSYLRSQCATPPPMTAMELVTLDRPEDERHSCRPLIPERLEYRPVPLPTDAPVRRRRRRCRLFRNRPTLIFGGDDRTPLGDYSRIYPFSAVGRVRTAGGGGGTGVMVGPRHMLTASHVIDWRGGSPGWLTFTPGQTPGNAPFGSTFGVRVYYINQVTGSIGSFEGRRDYACVVLNDRIGEETGAMGVTTYQGSWDDVAHWQHVGYPDDLGGFMPTWEGPVTLDRLGGRVARSRMRHKADVVAGQSGGPFFGLWDEGPFVAAVQSHEYDGLFFKRNYASGGGSMVDLVRQALEDHP